MTMRPTFWKSAALLLVVLVSWPPEAATQEPGKTAFKAEELEQLVAPIALYPDALVAQALMASTYPLDIVHAARFAKENAKLGGDQLSEALKQHPWDDSVKSLVSFPQVLAMMSEKLDWTQKLGDAFLAQQKDVLAAVQRLRAKAHETGNLKTTAEQKVTVVPAEAPAPPSAVATPAPQTVVVQPAPQTVVVQQPATTVITIEPTNPQIVYVPTYNPAVVYGSWPYPAYPPPAPYYPPGYVAGTALLSFGAGMAVGAALWGDCNWNSGHADVNINQYNSYSKNVNTAATANQRVSHYSGSTAQGGSQTGWQHNAERRGAVPYRDPATATAYGRGQSQQAAVQSREAFRGRTEQGPGQLERGGAAPGSRAGGQRGAGPSTMDRPGGAQSLGGAQGAGGQRPATMDRQGGGGVKAASGQAATRGGGQPSAFEGIGGGGGQAKRASDRGGQSLGRSGGGGGRSGGGGGRR